MTSTEAFRCQTAIGHSAVVLWQLYSAVTAFRSGDALAELLQALGAETGPGVSLFLLTHRWWLLVPAIFAVLSAIAIRRLESGPMFAVIVFAAGVATAVVMNIWWREAWFGPVFSLIKQIG